MDGPQQREGGTVTLKSRMKDIANVAQLRVILVPPAQQPALHDSGSHLCYHVMGLVHKIWAPVPGGIKDYIATPKSNGYRVGALWTMTWPVALAQKAAENCSSCCEPYSSQIVSCGLQ